ncbi:MAG: coproporphyrinogen III oxidase, partial [Lachnospiraceae bacterium]|nr:coproporphyrinogen III oxidase [Lachnospiraceae bacterium]
NRISIGLQSANNEELKSLGRIHSFEDFIKSYNILREAGFDNINVDLMSATMGQTVKSYENTLKKVIELGVEHISSYSLIIEEGTPLYEATDLDLPSEEDEREMYYLTEEMLNKAGYRRYERSNYAKPDRECKHNISYWIGTDYIGFGIGAASLFENVRFSNGRDLQSYIDSNGLNGPCEEEELSENARMEEFMFLGLHMMEGISKRYFYRSFKTEFDTVYGKVTKKLVKQGLLIEDDDNVRLSKKGIDVSNYVMSEYLLDSEKIV